MKRALENIDHAIQFCQATLARQLRSLATDCENAARNFEERPDSYIHNDLGIVQSQGTIIDAYCGRLGGLNEAKKIIEAAIKAEEDRAALPCNQE